jgi:gluconate 2-dehydrogenase gamma chain
MVTANSHRLPEFRSAANRVDIRNRGEEMSTTGARLNSRRIFLAKVAGASGALTVGSQLAFVPAGALVAASAQAEAQAAVPSVTDVAAGYASLSPDEAAFVEAMVNLMCPADGLTANGVDCGLAIYIDRQLAGAFGRGDRLYRHAPWQAGKAEHGYQLPLTPEEFFKAGIASVQATCAREFGKSFEQLAPSAADALLQDMAAGKITDPRLPLAQWFNELVYPLFTQACFADPIYGGNRSKVFWKLVGYPGLPAFHTQDMVAYRGKPFPGANDPKSIQDFS